MPRPRPSTRRPPATPDDVPGHPRTAALVLLVAVTLLDRGPRRAQHPRRRLSTTSAPPGASGSVRRSREVAAQPAAGATRVPRHQLVDDDAPYRLGRALGHPEVELAHRVGIGQRSGRERADPEDDLDPVTVSDHAGLEPVAGHLTGESIGRVAHRRTSQALAAPGAPADLDRGLPGAHDLGEPEGEPLVGPGDPPSALRPRDRPRRRAEADPSLSAPPAPRPPAPPRPAWRGAGGWRCG